VREWITNRSQHMMDSNTSSSIFRSPTASKSEQQQHMYQGSPATPGMFATTSATSTRTPSSGASVKPAYAVSSKASPPKAEGIASGNEAQATPISSHSLISNALKRYESSPQYRSSPLASNSDSKLSPMHNRLSPEVRYALKTRIIINTLSLCNK